MSTSLNLFVPGRLCLLGEHSDWAGFYKTINAEIIPGQALVTGINQGIYAVVTKDEKFIVESELDFFKGESFVCEMDVEELKKTAEAGGFFSYVAGVASYVSEHYNVGGLKVNITEMDLPVKSGLSSSAAVCVLVARAFNQLYGLNLNTMGEMRIAYSGEQRTPSRCGRLDQACAYGVNPVCMTFDGSEIAVKPLQLKVPLYYVIADLNAGKDTVKILGDLNKCYPFAQNEKEEQVLEALGKENEEYVFKAVKLLEDGDLESFGHLMEEYQQNFDKKVAPACPSQLGESGSPVLHKVMRDEKLRKYSYGIKGVGSQGDGTVQFLCKSEECQSELIKILKNEFNMDGFAMTLRPKQAVTKAIIPVAGFGTRLFPATKAIKKDFFPVLDRDGILKPAILILIEQLIEAGIEDICLVIGEGERPVYDEFFSALKREHYEKLSSEKKAYEDMLIRIGRRVTYVEQKERKGFGHAVYQCRDFTKKDPVLLLLGDMIYHAGESGINCMKQMVDAYEKTGLPVISMHTVPLDEVVHYGIMHGQWEDNSKETLLKLDRIAEKPSVDDAKEYLRVATKAKKDNYFAVFGQYVLNDEVFEILKENIDNNKLESGEIQLTSALEECRRRSGMMGYVVDGTSYDIGLPEMYIRTLSEYCK